MIKTFSEGILGSNTYLYFDEKSKEGMIVDCGNNPDDIFDFCNENGVNVRIIVLTHGHFDHAHFIENYKNKFSCAVTVCHEKEIPVLSDSMANVSMLFGYPEIYPNPDKTVAEGDILNVGNSNFEVLHTPGHTPGGICLYCEKEKIMFTGDTLFCGGRGRTDFKYGDESALISSLEKLINMDGEISFYSGHGMEGKIKYEKTTY